MTYEQRRTTVVNETEAVPAVPTSVERREYVESGTYVEQPVNRVVSDRTVSVARPSGSTRLS